MKTSILGFSCGIDSIDSANTSLLVSSETTSILVDVSGSPRMELLKAGADPLSLDAILITHAHIDHVYAFPSLLHSLWLLGRKKALVIGGNERAISTCKHMFDFFGLDRKVQFDIIWQELPVPRIGDIQIDTFSLFHRPTMPVNGFTFSCEGEKISYFPDSVATKPYPDSAYDSNVIIHESAGLECDRDTINSSHTTALQAAQLAKDLRGGKLILVHLPESQITRVEMLNEARSVFPNTILPTD